MSTLESRLTNQWLDIYLDTISELKKVEETNSILYNNWNRGLLFIKDNFHEDLDMRDIDNLKFQIKQLTELYNIISTFTKFDKNLEEINMKNITITSILKEIINPVDKISVDVPLFIRLLEYAREDAKTDMDLHDLTENITKLSETGNILSMKDYASIIPKKD